MYFIKCFISGIDALCNILTSLIETRSHYQIFRDELLNDMENPNELDAALDRLIKTRKPQKLKLKNGKYTTISCN